MVVSVWSMTSWDSRSRGRLTSGVTYAPSPAAIFADWCRRFRHLKPNFGWRVLPKKKRIPFPCWGFSSFAPSCTAIPRWLQTSGWAKASFYPASSTVSIKQDKLLLLLIIALVKWLIKSQSESMWKVDSLLIRIFWSNWFFTLWSSPPWRIFLLWWRE